MARFCFAAAAGCLFALASLPAAWAETALKLGYSLPPTSHYGVGAEAFARTVAENSRGRYRIELFAANALGGEREMIEGLQLGTIDLVVSSTGPVGNFVPSILVVDLPFLFRDYAHARAVLDGPIGAELLAEFPAHGLVALAWAENGFRHLTNSRVAVRRPEDLAGLKVRTMQNQVHMGAFADLGALPTPMSWPEVFSALQQGTVDGQENPIGVIVSAKFAQVQRYLSLTGHVYSPALFLMAPAVWDGLDAADRALFRTAAGIGATAMRGAVDRAETSGIESLRAAGMTVVEDVDRAAFQAALAPAYQAYARRFGNDRLERIRATPGGGGAAPAP